MRVSILIIIPKDNPIFNRFCKFLEAHFAKLRAQLFVEGIYLLLLALLREQIYDLHVRYGNIGAFSSVIAKV